MLGRRRTRRIDSHLDRGDQALRELRASTAALQRTVELNQRALEREFELNRQEWRNSREVHRAMIADIGQMREESRRHNEAVVGALTDLAAEIRSWGGGAAPATG